MHQQINQESDLQKIQIPIQYLKQVIMSDYDFYELPQVDEIPGKKASINIQVDQNKEQQYSLLGQNDHENYAEDFEQIDEQMKKSKVQQQYEESRQPKSNLHLVSRQQCSCQYEQNQSQEYPNRQAATVQGQTEARQHKSYRPQNKRSKLQYTILEIKEVGRVHVEFPDQVSAEDMTEKQIVKEMEHMRLIIKQFNEDLNDIMDRNRNMILKSQEDAKNKKVILAQHIIEGLELARENNRKVLQNLLHQIKRAKQKTDDLEDKSKNVYSEEILKHITQIDRLKKQIKQMQIGIERNSKNIAEIEEQDQQQNARRRNQLQADTAHAIKKNDDLTKREEQLQEAINNLRYKEKEIDDKYQKYKKIAEDKNLEVTTNKAFIEIKQKYTELIAHEEQAKKAINLIKRRIEQSQQLVDKQTEEIKKETQKNQQQIQMKNTEIKEIEQVIKIQNEKFKQIEKVRQAPVWKNQVKERQTSSTQKNEQAYITQVKKQLHRYNKSIEKQHYKSQNFTNNKQASHPILSKPFIAKRKENQDRKERQWKQVIQEPKPLVQFSISETKLQAKVEEKQIFRFNKRNTVDKSNQETSQVKISSQQEPETKIATSDNLNLKPKMRRLKRPDENDRSISAIQQQKKEEKVPITVETKEEQIKKQQPPKFNMILRPFGKRKNQSRNQDTIPPEINKITKSDSIDAPKIQHSPTQLSPVNPNNPFIKDHLDKNNVVRLEKPTKVKIQKPKLKKFDISTAQQVIFDDVEHKQQKLVEVPPKHTHNTDISLEELLGKRETKKPDQYDELILPKQSKAPIKKQKIKQQDFFGDIDV